MSLTIFPLDHELEGHAIDPMIARNTDQRDATARSRYLPAIQASRRNVVLIVVDALRPDHMGVYGYTRNTTPYLSALEQTKAVRKVVAHASCGDTICGLLSLATSKFPRAFSFHPFSLHEVLKLNGYTIRLILSGDHSNFYGLKRFYGAVDSFFDGTQADGYALNDDQAVVDHVSNMPVWDGKPVMLQFHLMSAHVLRKVEDNAGTFEPAHRYLLRSGHDIGARSIVDRAATNFYDNGVVKADSVIQSLLAALGRKGYLTDTLVVITADHGESLGEHGLFQHANSVREQLLRIPLMLVSFGYTPAAELDPNRFASQVDIAPTILAEVQIVPPYTWAGRALQTAIQSDFTFFEEHQELGLFDHRDPKVLWKYWADPRTGEQHAFNLSADPEEGNDQLASLPRSLLAQWQYRALSDAPK